MNRFYLACGLFGALLLACGCAKEKAEVPSWFTGGKKDAPPPPLAKNSPQQLQKDLKQKIAQLEKKKGALDEVIAGLDKGIDDLKIKLLKRGVRSSEDMKKPEIKDDEEIQRMAVSLIKKSHDHSKYQQVRKQYNIALLDGKEALESLNDQLKLAKEGIDPKDLDDLAGTIRKIERIDDRLNGKDSNDPVEQIKGDVALDKALKGN